MKTSLAWVGFATVVSFASLGCFGSSDPQTLDSSVLGNQPTEPDGAVASGPAKLELSVSIAAGIDFGLVDCGATAGEKTVTLKNAGGDPLAWSALIDGGKNMFSLSGPQNGTLESGQTATITLRAAQVPSSAHPGTVSSASLRIDSNVAGAPRTDLPLKLTSAGGELLLVPANVDFGLYPVGATAPEVPLTLTNKGNKSVSIAVTQPVDPQFSVAWTGSPTAITLGTNETAAGLSGRFAPSTTSPSSSFAGLKVTGAVCGASVQQIAMKGQGTNGVVGVTPAGLDFGQVDCGTSAAAKKITVSNTGNGTFTFDAKLDAAGSNYFTLSPQSGSVAAASTTEITVTPKSIPGSSPVTPNYFGGALIVTTSAVADTPHSVALTQTAHGAIVTVNPSSVNFSSVPVATSQTAGVTLTNSGNASVGVTMSAAGTGFSVTPAAGTLTGGDTLQATTTFSPSSAGAATGALRLAASGNAVLCAPLPADVALAGTGTSGSVSLSAQSFDFGATNCGAQANARTLALQNPGSASYTWTASLAKGTSSPYALSKGSGTVAAAGSDALSITPTAIPQTSAVPGNYGDVLTVTTNVPGDAPHTLVLAQSAQGAILKFVSSAALDFGQVGLSSTSSASVSLVNEGNLAVNPTLVSSSPLVTISPSSFTLAGAGTNASVATFKPVAVGVLTGSISLSPTLTTGTLCAPLPSDVAFTGEGTQGAATVSPASLSFGESGYANCGTQASAQAVTLKNDGTAAFNVASVTVPTGYSYTTPGGTAVAVGKSISIVVTPPAVPATLAAITSYGGTMSVKTDIPGDNAHSVALSLTSRGAILARTGSGIVTFADTTLPGSSTQTVSFTNSGNSSATLNVSTTANSGFSGPSSVTVATTGGSGTFTFAPAAGGSQSATVSLAAASGAVLCSAVPANFGLAGTGLAGSATFSASSISFGTSGYADCGTQASAQTITVKNDGTAAFNLTSVAVPTGYSYTTPGGTAVGAGKSVSITVTPPPVPATLASVTSYAGAMTVKTDIPNDTAHSVALSLTSRGAILARTGSGNVAFADTAVSSSSTQTVSFTNVGNSTATLNVSTTVDSAFSGPSSVTVATTGGSGTFTFAPFAGGSQSATVSLAAASGTVLCSAAPANFGLTGTGLAGTATLSTSSISFGSSGYADCGTQASAQSVTVKNDGSAAFNLTSVSLPKGYSYTTPGGTAVGAGKSVSIAVTPPAIPATLSAVTSYGGTMTVKTDIANDTAHSVALSLTSYGAILARSTSGTVTFSDTTWPSSSSQTVSVTNVGNASATLNVTTSANSGFAGPSSILAAAGSGGSGSFTFTPITYGNHAALVSLSAAGGTALCSAVPSNFDLSGNGLAGALSVSVSSVSFGTISCGASASQQTLTVSNIGNAPITGFYASFGGSNFYQKGFTTSQSGTTLAAGASTTAGAGVISNDLGAESDTLTLHATAPVSSVSVPFSVKRTGAFVSVSASAMTMATNGTHAANGTFQITNTGDQSITLTATVTPNPSGSFYFGDVFQSTQKPDTTLVASGGKDTGMISVYLGGTSANNGSATLSFAQSGANGVAPLCGTLPTIAITATP